MKKTLFFTLTLALLFRCGGQNEGQLNDSTSYESKSPSSEGDCSGYIEESAELAEAEEDYGQVISSIAVKPSPLDSSKKFIRNANIKFRTQNVFAATQNIEAIVRKYDGWIAKTDLSSQVSHVSTYQYKKDSILEVTRYTPVNSIEMRIPTKHLDSALIQMVPLIDFLDHRNLECKDITLDLLREHLSKQRLSAYSKRVDQKQSSIKDQDLDDVINVADNLLQKQAIQDASKLEDLRLNDKVEYSTTTLYIYERQKSKAALLPAPDKWEDTLPAYSEQLGDGFAKGFSFVKELFVGIITVWPLWLILALAWFLYNRFRK